MLRALPAWNGLVCAVQAVMQPLPTCAAGPTLFQIPHVLTLFLSG